MLLATQRLLYRATPLIQFLQALLELSCAGLMAHGATGLPIFGKPQVWLRASL
ncbi:MAG: hypothetical protein JSS48_03975 [Nitrospira sp.]|nr:hypothetical protein [Nitrospira sp.]